MAERQPDKVFVRLVSNGAEFNLSYAEMLAQSRRYAAFYQRRGLRKGDVMLLMLQHGAENYPAFVGAILAGIVPAFMPLPGPKQPPEIYWPIHREVVDRKDIKAILTYAGHAQTMQEHMPGARLLILCVEDMGWVGACAEPLSEPVVRSSDIAFIQHSSGTTGVKKGVSLSHQTVLAQIDAYAELLGFDEDASVASWLPLYHDMGLITSFLMPMAKGASIVACSPFEWLINPDIWLRAAAQYGCAYTWMPNFAFAHLAKAANVDPAWDLSAMRWINCSEPCKASSFVQFKQKFADVGVTDRVFQVCYAMAENVFAVTQTRSGEFPRRNVRPAEDPLNQEGWGQECATLGSSEVLSCGQPIPGVEIQIWDETGMPLPEKQVGEIVIRGPYLFSGYHDDSDSTAARLRNGWFLTHDLGFMDKGELFVTGRVDDLINLYGRKVYAHDVESAVNSVVEVIPGRCVAIGHALEDSGSQELIVLAETASDIEAAALKRAIKLKIEAEVGVTAGRVELLPKGWLIKTTSGKISRYLNYRKYHEMYGRT
jgi:acyl-CoA synthetase (AMP-forming)/AMP-acid ligase II